MKHDELIKIFANDILFYSGVQYNDVRNTQMEVKYGKLYFLAFRRQHYLEQTRLMCVICFFFHIFSIRSLSIQYLVEMRMFYMLQFKAMFHDCQ